MENEFVKLHHEELLQAQGYHIVSPISGSMRPMIRIRRDSVRFVPVKERLKPYDVALYRNERGQAAMHRVLRVLPKGYQIRGDNARITEFVEEERIFGVMEGFYRDEKYIPKENLFYRFYARLWVTLHPLLMLYKKLRWGR